MSAKTDRERTEDRREAAKLRSEGILAKLTRLRSLWLEGKSDSEIAEALGWSKRTVIDYRQVLALALGLPVGGRWRARARRIAERGATP